MSDLLVYEGRSGPGKGKHIVFLSGDEEYRSEEALPQLARILGFRHGFKCTVLFPLDDAGNIDPNASGNEPGLEALDSADLCIMLLRFRKWPDSQMGHFTKFYLAGKSTIALRTSTHAFDYPADSRSENRRFGWRSSEWPGGFGKQVLGETWVSHWGAHGKQATKGVVSKAAMAHPILRGVQDILVTTDVYEISPPADAEALVRGQVLIGMSVNDPPSTERKKTADGAEQGINDPMMPVFWLRRPRNDAGKTNRVVACTMGAATDFLSEGLRRLIVNSAYWAVGLERNIPCHANADVVGSYQPSPSGFDGFRTGVKPADLQFKFNGAAEPRCSEIVLDFRDFGRKAAP